MREWTGADTARFLRVPGADDDKRSRGVVTLRTGSESYPGAAVLGVEGAWRTGCGFVRYVGSAASAVLSRRPETVIGEGSHTDAWVIGSGTDPRTRTQDEEHALRKILAGDAPVVVDAGALDLIDAATAPLIVTPHAREFVRLRERLGMPVGDPDHEVERIVQAEELATDRGLTVLLKGARTVVASPDRSGIVVGNAPGWLATAGTGDVLAGILGALVAANPDAPLAETAASAAWLHGEAARIASGTDRGGVGHPIVALDVAASLPSAIARLWG